MFTWPNSLGRTISEIPGTSLTSSQWLAVSQKLFWQTARWMVHGSPIFKLDPGVTFKKNPLHIRSMYNLPSRTWPLCVRNPLSPFWALAKGCKLWGGRSHGRLSYICVTQRTDISWGKCNRGCEKKVLCSVWLNSTKRTRVVFDLGIIRPEMFL